MYVYIYIYVYIHTYIHAYIHTCMHTYIHTYIHACMHACIHFLFTQSPNTLRVELSKASKRDPHSHLPITQVSSKVPSTSMKPKSSSGLSCTLRLFLKLPYP